MLLKLSVKIAELPMKEVNQQSFAGLDPLYNLLQLDLTNQITENGVNGIKEI